MGKRRQIVLTDRDRALLEALARCVHTFSLGQVSRTWYPQPADPSRAARARVALLADAGYVTVVDALAHPELEMAEPVIEWDGRSPTPDFVSVSRRLRARWTQALEPTRLLTIQNSAAATFGGYPAPPLRTDEITHDLHLAAVYLVYRERSPDQARLWVGERVIRKTRPISAGPLPDAMIRGTSLTKIIEFGGAYSSERVRVFHASCESQATPYELW